MLKDQNWAPSFWVQAESETLTTGGQDTELANMSEALPMRLTYST